MTHNVRRPRTYSTYLQRKSIWFLFPPPQALSPLCYIPYKMIKWSLDTHLSFVVLRFVVTVQCVGLCVCQCVSNPEGRRIICCNCFPAGALLTDRYLRYGSCTAQYQYFHRWTDNWVLAVISSLLSLQLASMSLDVSYLCVNRRCNSIKRNYVGLRCGPTHSVAAFKQWGHVNVMFLSYCPQ